MFKYVDNRAMQNVTTLRKREKYSMQATKNRRIKYVKIT